MNLTRNYLFAASSIVLSAAAQLSLKAAMLAVHGNAPQDFAAAIAIISQSPASCGYLAIGLICYAVSMLCWMAAITRLQLSFAYPLLALSYVLVYIAAVYWPMLHEHLSWQRSIGIGLVLAGVIMVSRSGETQ